MAHARRVPDPSKDLEIKTALRRLLQGLKLDDPLVRRIKDPLLAASTHLTRCKPQPTASARTQFIAIPKSGKRCCGKALVIKFLAVEDAVHPTVQPLYEAVVQAEPLLRDMAALLQHPLPAMLRALERQHRAQESAEIAPRPQRKRTLTISRPANNPSASWLIDALRGFYRSTPKHPRPQVLHEQLLLLLNALHLAVHVRRQLEERLRQQFVLPDLHRPVLGRGRPTLGLLKELRRVLSATGHEPAELAHLLPDGSGTIGAAKRAREHLRPARQRASKVRLPTPPPTS